MPRNLTLSCAKRNIGASCLGVFLASSMAVNNNAAMVKIRQTSKQIIIHIIQYFIHFDTRKLPRRKFFERIGGSYRHRHPSTFTSIYPPYDPATFLLGARKSITRRRVEYGVRKLAPRRTSVSEVVRQGGTKSRVAFFTRVQPPVGVVKRQALVALTIANIILSF